MSDGTIIFETIVDDAKAQEKLHKLGKKVDETREKLEEKKSRQSWMKTELEAANKNFDQMCQEISAAKKELKSAEETIFNIDKKTSASEWMDARNRVDELKQKLKDLAQDERAASKDVEKFANEYAKATDQVTKAEHALKRVEDEAGEAAQKIIDANAETRGWKGVVNELDKRFEKLGSRIKKLALNAALFTVVASGFRKLKDYLWDVILVNNEASAALADLKGALLTLAQPIVEIVVPAFTTLVKILTAVISRILQLVSLFTGKSVSASAEAAKALNQQTKALNGTGSAAKKAGQQLAAFDELNVLSSTDDSGSGAASSWADITPDFDFMDGIDEKFQNIADWVLLIGAGFATWKILNSIPWERISNFFNGATGFDLAKKFAGIALIIVGLKEFADAIADIEENGANLENTLKLIASIVATGLGFLLLTGSVIPMVIAGVASIEVAILALTGNLEEFIHNFKENILGGFIEFLTGAFWGDWEKAWHGVKKIFAGVWNSVVMIFESAVNIIIKGINWLITQLNKVRFDIPDWVPSIGGKSFGINIPAVNEVHLKRIEIPALAKGAVIPPNREFLALLGDQKSGTNIETPLDTMVGAFRQALSQDGYSGGETRDVLLTLLSYVRSIADSSERTAQKDFSLGKPNSAAGRWVQQSVAAYKGVTG